MEEKTFAELVAEVEAAVLPLGFRISDAQNVLSLSGDSEALRITVIRNRDTEPAKGQGS